MRTIAIVVTDLVEAPSGMPSRQAALLGDRPCLAWTVGRMLAVPGVDQVVLVHPPGQDPMALLDRIDREAKSVEAFAAPVSDPYRGMRIAARKWAMSAWRGGLGGATCYDELLPADRLRDVMEAFHAQTALLVGGDWPLVNPALCQALLDRRALYGDAMAMTFCQAPPGLAGIAMSADLIKQIADNPASTIGGILAYRPDHPQADPIGKDVCVQISPAVRSSTHRYIYDLPASVSLINRLINGTARPIADNDEAIRICSTANDDGIDDLPRQLTLELTARRLVAGPLTAQAWVQLDRQDMTFDDAQAVLRQLDPTTCPLVTLGGLGDPLLHPDWDRIVQAAHEAGAYGICIETDLLTDSDTLARILDLPIDIVTVRLNADTAGTYERVMKPTLPDAFAKVIGNLETLFSTRNQRRAQGPGGDGRGVPWIVPRLIKTADTLADLETFFDRWMMIGGHAVIDPAVTGAGQAPMQAPVVMAPPRRKPCRQLNRRLTILSDARLARCDQDWCGDASNADQNNRTTDGRLRAAWAHARPLRTAHREGRWDDLTPCKSCTEWHRT